MSLAPCHRHERRDNAQEARSLFVARAPCIARSRSQGLSARLNHRRERCPGYAGVVGGGCRTRSRRWGR